MENVNIVSRNKAHDLAVQTMYAFLMLEKCNQLISFESLIELVFNQEYKDVDIYIRELLLISLKNQNIAITNIEKYLDKWAFNRLNYCMQAILILSYCEFFYIKDSDKAVIINIAVKLAKKYGDERDYRFVNAVLDKALNGRD